MFKEFIHTALAQPSLEMLKNAGTAEGAYADASGDQVLATTLGTIIQAGLGLLGVIFIILIIYAGYNWMTARGQEEKVTKAQETIWRAIIGLIILIGSYAIWNFIARIL